MPIDKIKKEIKKYVSPSKYSYPQYGCAMTKLYHYESAETDSNKIADMYMYAVDRAFNYLNTVGDMDESYYDEYINLFEEFVDRINKIYDNEKKLEIKTKVDDMIKNTNMGYGVGDEMEDYIESVLYVDGCLDKKYQKIIDKIDVSVNEILEIEPNTDDYAEETLSLAYVDLQKYDKDLIKMVRKDKKVNKIQLLAKINNIANKIKNYEDIRDSFEDTIKYLKR